MCRTRTYWLGLSLMALTLSACGGATPENVQSRTSPIVARALREARTAWISAAESAEIKQLTHSLGQFVPGLPDTSNLELGRPFDEQLASRVNDQLADYIFVEDNVEDASGDTVTFRLRGSVFCGRLKLEQCSAREGEIANCTSSGASSNCIQMVDQAEIRIAATLVGSDGVDFRLSIGGGPVAVTLRLRPERVDIELSLSGVAAAARRIAEITGEKITLPSKFEGAISFALVFNATGDLTLQAGVPENVLVEEVNSEGNYRLSVEARESLIALRLRNQKPLVTLDLDWGAIQMLLPARQVWREASGSLELILQGLSARLASDGQGGLGIQGLGLGEGSSRLSLNGRTLVQVDLNPTKGRHVNVQLLPASQGGPQLVVAPELDIQVVLALAPLQSLLDRAIEPWLLNESYQLTLSGSTDAAVAPLPESASAPAGLRVVRGKLVLQSKVMSASVAVSAGQCLIWNDAVLPGGHPLLGHLQQAACP